MVCTLLLRGAQNSWFHGKRLGLATPGLEEAFCLVGKLRSSPSLGSKSGFCLGKCLLHPCTTMMQKLSGKGVSFWPVSFLFFIPCVFFVCFCFCFLRKLKKNWLHPVGSQFTDQGSNPCPQQLKLEVLTTGPNRKFPLVF